MPEVHKESKDFEKMKKEDLISECLILNKLLLQLKDENFPPKTNNKMVDNLIDKVNEKTSNQIHDNNKAHSINTKARFFFQSIYQDRHRHLFSLKVHTKKFNQKI